MPDAFDFVNFIGIKAIQMSGAKKCSFFMFQLIFYV